VNLPSRATSAEERQERCVLNHLQLARLSRAQWPVPRISPLLAYFIVPVSTSSQTV